MLTSFERNEIATAFQTMKPSEWTELSQGVENRDGTVRYVILEVNAHTETTTLLGGFAGLAGMVQSAARYQTDFGTHGMHRLVYVDTFDPDVRELVENVNGHI